MIEINSDGFVKPLDEFNLELNKCFKNFLDDDSFEILDTKKFKIDWDHPK